jgi:hypothetical protein
VSLSEAAGWAQVLLAIAAIAAVLVSIVVSNLTLREVRKDRRAGAMPVVVFDPGGHHLPVTFEKAGRAIPGVNPAYVAKVLPERFEAGESVRLDWSKLGEHYGELRNLGRGAALSIDVTWIPERVTIGSDSFEVDDQKRQEPIYGKALNQMPPWQSHLSAGGSTGLTRLPTFVEKDIDHKLTGGHRSPQDFLQRRLWLSTRYASGLLLGDKL